MKNRIIVDSCMDYSDDLQFLKDEVFKVPFKIIIDDTEIIDEKLDTNELLEKMKNKKTAVKSSCPSPNDYLDKFDEADDMFVVTISSRLSGSYNSAEIAKNMYKETNPSARIHVFDSKSAASGESLIVLKIKELIDKKMSFDDIVKGVNEYIESLNTLFILNSFDNLVKNGRISAVKAKLASLLHIVPIFCGDEEGHIDLKDRVRGRKKANIRLIEIIKEMTADGKAKILSISQVNALEEAKKLKSGILEKCNIDKVSIFDGSGLTTLYADDGGLIITF